RPLTRLSEVIADFGERPEPRAEASGVLEIREIASQFNTMADKLEERKRDMLQFVASVAHDLRNPLAALLSAAEVLRAADGVADKQLGDLVARQVRHLDQLLGDLLEVSRIEAGHLVLRLRETDLAALVRDSVALARAGTTMHEFVVDLPAEPLKCQCDPARVMQVLNNILSNAVKYSPTGGMISINAERSGAWARVSIGDQGAGIDAAEHESIFLPFQRSSGTRDAIPGIGLGLSASRRIVEAHGGTLTVASRLGEGAVFTMSLPLRGPSAPQEGGTRAVRGD